MIASEIISLVRTQINDTAGTQYGDNLMLSWINAAIRDLALGSDDLLQKIGTVSVDVGTDEVTLPTDILKLRSVKFNGKKLDGISLQQADELDVLSGEPTSFYVFANKIYLTPKSNIAADLKIYYTYAPPPVGSVSEAPPIPVNWHNRLVEYCVAQAAKADDDLDRATLELASMNKTIDSSRDSAPDPNDEYPFITYYAEYP